MMMTNETKMSMLKLIFNTLFQSKQLGTDITQVMITTNMGNFLGRWFTDKTLRGFDVDINLGDRTISIRCVEQNPNKMDNKGNLKWSANLARQGHKMMWVIDRNGGFLGRMQDEEWIPGFEPATQPATMHAYHADGTHETLPGHVQNYGQAKTYTNQQSAQNPAAQNACDAYGQDLANSIVPEELPEIAGGADIPDYILEAVGAMDEPPPDMEDGY